jgi:hypothetical protein
LGRAFGVLNKPVNDTANKAGRKPAATMWHRKKNEPIDSRLMSEKEVFQDCILFVG